MGYFADKHAAISGAGSGIGRALAQALNEAGCHLYLSDIDAQGLAETIASLSRPDISHHMSIVDMAQREAVQRWAAEVSEHAPELHLLVNNAGVALAGTAAQTRLRDYQWLMGINFWGVVYGCSAFMPLLEKAPRSHLVNMSSVLGLMALPAHSAYNASKFAVRGYSESLRQELDLSDSPVKVCCVHPGGIDTNIARRARNSDPRATAESQQAEFARVVRTSARSAAEQILRAAERGQRRLLIGADARLVDWMVRLFPSGYARFLRGRGRALLGKTR